MTLLYLLSPAGTRVDPLHTGQVPCMFAPFVNCMPLL
jgi:hypothetical protein